MRNYSLAVPCRLSGTVWLKVNKEGKVIRTDLGCHAVSSAGLRRLDCWDRGFESR
jgi:hypothetical protein